MANSGGYVVKVSGKREANGPDETLYIDLGRIILASDGAPGLAVVLEGAERVFLTGEDATWVREILDSMAQPRKGERSNGLRSGRG